MIVFFVFIKIEKFVLDVYYKLLSVLILFLSHLFCIIYPYS